MPDQLYRKCPACRESVPVTPCPTCGGERYIPARFDGTGRRWGMRISTLMLLVVIAGLASFIAVVWLRQAQEARCREAALVRVLLDSRLRDAIAAQANAQAQAPTPAPAEPTQ
jgi:rRNA maturation protein Nop10